MDADALLRDLNPAQREAVTHGAGPLLVLAGPGSGKTRVIVHRIAYLVGVHGVPPWRVVAVTFTNRAAREMQERLQALLGPLAERVFAGTFHALCARILRQDGPAIGLDRSFAIYDEDDQVAVLKRAYEEVGVDPKRFPLRSVQDAISGAKARLLDPEGWRAHNPGLWGEVVYRLYTAYQDLLRRSQGVDFDDLLVLAYRLLKEHPEVRERWQERAHHLLVDEFQDTNYAQYALARLLAERHRNLFVVGDPDQAIYSWRHADLRNILTFQQDYPDARVVRLEENYRSTPPILEVARRIISANRLRLEKGLRAVRPEGPRPIVHEAYNEEEEARFVVREAERLVRQAGYRYRDIAVMYRVNAQSRALEEACLRYGVPYRVIGALKFYQRREVKDILSYLRLLLNPQDEVALQRVVNVPPRGIGPRTLERLGEWARRRGWTLPQALDALARGEGEEAPLTPQGRSALARFARLLEDLREEAGRLDLVSLVDEVVQRIGYREYLEQGLEKGEERWENLLELRRVAGEFREMEPRTALASFLERVSLVSEQDALLEEQDALTLITLHQAKGLEFPVVFLVGLEEGLLPHIRSLGDPERVEEERRLCYVGVTRARDRLYLVWAFRRAQAGESGPNRPSRFLQDLPPGLVEAAVAEGPAPMRQRGLEPAPAPGAPPAPAPPPLRVGDWVRHARFGLGVVVAVVPSGPDTEVTVKFEEVGLKRLLYSYAPMERVTRDGQG